MEYGPYRDGEEPELGEILGSAFVFPPKDIGEWFDRAGRENVRVVRDGALPIAGLLEIPMGHFLGGRSVPTIGIAGVGVALERRASNVARTLMHECVREIAERGVALSTLYPATQTLYRGAGYERAGKCCEISIPVSQLETTVDDDGLELRRLSEDDVPRVKELYATVARELHGHLDRGPYIWSRVTRPRGREVRAFGFFREGILEAYAYLCQTRSDPFSNYHDLWATDLWSTSAHGYAALFRFCRSQRSLAENLELRHAPSAPMLNLLKENRFSEKSEVDWMVRVTDAVAALEARGYPAAIRSAIAIDLRDELVAKNHGTFTLHLDDGRARVERGGRATATMDIRAFAQLYMGYLPATVLHRLGSIEGEPGAMSTLDAIFGGPIPAIADMF